MYAFMHGASSHQKFYMYITYALEHKRNQIYDFLEHMWYGANASTLLMQHSGWSLGHSALQVSKLAQHIVWTCLLLLGTGVIWEKRFPCTIIGKRLFVEIQRTKQSIVLCIGFISVAKARCILVETHSPLPNLGVKHPMPFQSASHPSTNLGHPTTLWVFRSN